VGAWWPALGQPNSYTPSDMRSKRQKPIFTSRRRRADPVAVIRWLLLLAAILLIALGVALVLAGPSGASAHDDLIACLGFCGQEAEGAGTKSPA